MQHKAMGFLTKLRIAGLILALVIFVSGFRSWMHPKFKLVQTASPRVSAEGYPEYVTSKGSQFFSVVKMVAGCGLAIYVLWPAMRKRTFKT